MIHVAPTYTLHILHLVVHTSHKTDTEDRNDKQLVYDNNNNNKDVLEENMVMAGVVSDGAESHVGPGCLVCTLHWH